MPITNVASARERLLYIVKETTLNQVASVPSATDAVFVLGDVPIANERELLEDLQKKDTASKLPMLAGRHNPPGYSFETYIKPSGTAGTPPEVSTLLECALGTYTNTGGISDAYTLADSLDSFTLWTKDGHTTFMVTGCTVNELGIQIPVDNIGRFSFSGQGLRRYFAGTATTASESASGQKDVVLTSGQAKRFCVGAYVEVGTDDNSGSGHVIASIDYDTDTLTMTDNLVSTTASGGTVKGFLPDTATAVGTPVHSKLGTMTMDTVDTKILNATITLSNNLNVYNDEKNDSLWPDNVARPNFREVSADFSAYFYRKHAQFFYLKDELVTVALSLPIGSTAGSICTIGLPQFKIQNPNITGDGDRTIEVSGIAEPSASYNDELSVTFT